MRRSSLLTSVLLSLACCGAQLLAQSVPTGFIKALSDPTRHGKAIQVEDQVISYADVRRALAPVVE